MRYDDRIGRPTLELVNPIILILLIRVATIHFPATNLYYPTFSCEILVNLDHCPNCQKRVMPASFTALSPLILSNCQVKIQALFLMFKHSSLKENNYYEN